ncbi:hypothetical protein POM88_034293 [Heracleum sosnowskyi]|uniref:Uncharacterized protein n=1 Tax=Heracleum sosnowskyi TaxID=360622 RepID=A0AAD8HKB9_9APIA|nr:hypothetical protein POM88_034293 [Heracleum sosnowskyi]
MIKKVVLEGQKWFIKFGFLNFVVSWRSNVRGYMANMMVQNPTVCNSFEGLENAENAIAVDSKKASIEVIILDDSEDEDVVELTAALEELTRDEEKASAANGVTTDTLSKTEKRPCLDKGKNIIIEVEDDGEEFDRQAQETRKAIGESSRPMGDTETEVEDNDQTLGFLEPSRNLNRGETSKEREVARLTASQSKPSQQIFDNSLDFVLRVSSEVYCMVRSLEMTEVPRELLMKLSRTKLTRCSSHYGLKICA